MEFGVRINSKAYFRFYIEPENGIVDVLAEIVMDDGTVVKPTGTVVWEEGE